MYVVVPVEFNLLKQRDSSSLRVSSKPVVFPLARGGGGEGCDFSEPWLVNMNYYGGT